ncbi:hypothetical protein EVAR_32545_1 [Eumeta japonica]|uniref:Uncharacterized protein n=1 Tax=Eumeta variegata TaxID=151549 RepID=A0A4C1VRS4_EUMVA|nr:hypothetical protein EVAR_32545_1 [Eumeta japonica]
MDDKKVNAHFEPQSKINKIKDSTEIFVLSPLFLQNLGISFKDITQETSSTGKKKDDQHIGVRSKVLEDEELEHLLDETLMSNSRRVGKIIGNESTSSFKTPKEPGNDPKARILGAILVEAKIARKTKKERIFTSHCDWGDMYHCNVMFMFVVDVNVENKQQVNSSDDLPVSNKIQQDETSIAETANLMKNSVFMSPTFVPQDNNENLIEIVKSEENGKPNNLTSNEETISEINFLEDATVQSAAQIVSSDALNENCLYKKSIDSTQVLTESALGLREIHNISPLRDAGPSILKSNVLADTTALCGAQITSSDGVNSEKDIDNTQLLAECTLVSRINDNISPLRNTGPNDYVCKNSILNEQNTLILSIPNDMAISCESHIKEYNSQNQDSNFLGQNVEIGKIQIVTDISHQEASASVRSNENEQGSDKKNDSFEQQASYSDNITTEYIEILNVNKDSDLISDDLIELNELISINNNNIVNSVPENRTMNECVGISMLIETDFMDFECIDSLHSSDTSLQNVKNDRNHHILEKPNKMDVIEQKQFLHENEDVHKRNQNDVSAPPSHLKTTNDMDKNIEGAQYSFTNDATEDNVILSLHQIEEHRHLSDLSINDDQSMPRIKLCQFTKTCHTHCNKEDDVPNVTEEVNTTEFVDNSETMVFVPAVAKNVDNRNIESISVMDVDIQESVQLPKSSLLMDAHENSVNCDISKTEIYVANLNLDQNLSVCQDQECLSEVSTASNVKSKIQAKKHKAILCDKLKNSKSKMQETKKHRRDYSKCEAENVNALTPTYKNQFSLTGNISDAVTNVNLIASYLKKITQIHSQGQNFKSLKNSKKISKVSVQGVEKPGGSNELLLEQENDFQLNTNLSIKKTYNKKNVLSKQSLAIRPIVNKICDETLCHNNYSLDYVEKPVSVNVTMGFCVCVDYGHLFYDNNYVDLEHLHYQNKFSDDSNITNQGSFNFNFNMSLSDEISEAMKDVTETPDIHINSICWKTIEESIEQNECITDEKNQIKDNNILTLGNKYIEKTVSNANILENDNVKTMDNLKMADSDNLFQHKCCFDPKVRNRSGFDFDANDFLPIVRKSLVSSDNLVTKKDSTMYGMKTSDATEIQKLTMQSENLLTLSSSAKVDNSMDEKIQNEDIVNVALPMAVPSKRSLNHLMNANDENDSKLSQVSDVTNETRDLSSNQDYLIMEDIDNSKSVNESTLSKVDDKVIEIKQTFVCGVCEEFVKNTEWVNHIQAQHDYLAWKKECEPAGALPRRRDRARARRADGAVTGVYHRNERKRNITVSARCTLRGTPHTHTRAEPDTTERGSKEY